MSKRKMLIVDDDLIFLETLARAMQKRGFETVTANNLKTALILAETHLPERAVIDLKIEKESGLTLLPALKEINPLIKMLILTGYSSISTAVAAVKLGAVDYVCKPADADEILAAFDIEKSASVTTPISENPPSVKRLQWEHVQKVLKENHDNISATARSLGMHRRTLQRFLQKKPVKR